MNFWQRENRGFTLTQHSQTGHGFWHCYSVVDFQGPKHPLPSLSVLATGARQFIMTQRYLMPLQKYFPFLQEKNALGL